MLFNLVAVPRALVRYRRSGHLAGPAVTAAYADSGTAAYAIGGEGNAKIEAVRSSRPRGEPSG